MTTPTPEPVDPFTGDPHDPARELAALDDCGEPHWFGWDLLRGNLRHPLDVGTQRVHEPASAPDPADYVTWE